MKRMSSDPAMRDAAFEHNRRMMDMAQLRYEGKQEGLAEGREEGRIEGREEGIEQGIERGIEQGIEKQRLETAKEMLRNHCNDQFIQLCTKINLQQLELLKKKSFPVSVKLRMTRKNSIRQATENSGEIR